MCINNYSDNARHSENASNETVNKRYFDLDNAQPVDEIKHHRAENRIDDELKEKLERQHHDFNDSKDDYYTNNGADNRFYHWKIRIHQQDPLIYNLSSFIYQSIYITTFCVISK